MLKLEKRENSGDIAIVVYDRGYSYLHPTFLKAFSLALFFHLAFFVVFRVAPFRPHVSTTIFSPTHVETLLPDNATAFTHITVNTPVDIGLPPFPLLEPPIASIPKFTIPLYQRLRDQSISAVDNHDILQRLYDSHRKPKLGMEIVVSGPLSEKGSLKQTKISFSSMDKGETSLRVRYSVALDYVSGKIFWSAPLEVSENRRFNQFSTSLLQELEFEGTSDARMNMTGEIEMHYYGAEYD